jgi:ferrous iron transport protein A
MSAALESPASLIGTPSIPDLGAAPVGFRGTIRSIQVPANGLPAGLPTGELERRLLELGFIEGASVQILHQGLFGQDPIAVRVGGATIALRRREATAILVDQIHTR